ncbi:MAG: acyltransferase family protein [Scytonematopsis contorta HA4267-MV1]|jgi:hypothetical protein|nr:acyltransferase family protein [Scytonematopsis contorta HA4267-MV1]
MEIERDNRLDILKAIGIIFVLMWHLRPISLTINNNTHDIIFVITKIIQTFELQLYLTAVPLFYLVSLYLFFLKKPSKEYFKYRLVKLFKLFAFWSIFHNIFLILLTRELPDFSWEFITGLKPSLPFVGDSVFYFLFNLIGLTIISFSYVIINSIKIRKIISCIIVLFSFSFFEIAYINNLNIPYHWLINFIIYIPISFYLANNQETILRLRFTYLLAYILFSAHDIYLRTVGNYGSIYGRISIVCGALTIFSFIFSQKISVNWYIQKLSKYSLGIFALHKYWQYLLFLLVNQNFEFAISINLLVTPLNIIFMIVSILVIFFTTLSVYLLKKTSFKQFIS